MIIYPKLVSQGQYNICGYNNIGTNDENFILQGYYTIVVGRIIGDVLCKTLFSSQIF